MINPSTRDTLTMGLGHKKRSAWLQDIARSMVFSKLREIHGGRIHIIEGSNTEHFGHEPGPACNIHVHDPRFYGEIAFGGSIGAGEAYMLGYWTCDNLTYLIRIMALNQQAMDSLEGGFAWLTRPLLKGLHWLNRNTHDGSRRNIAAHYDLGNDLFQLFLDPTMMYSSAIFDTPDMSLQQASTSKLERICRKLELSPEDHVLEIGTGWGGFAIHAAGRFGCKVTTTTISQAQYDLACERVAQAGLTQLVTVLLKD